MVNNNYVYIYIFFFLGGGGVGGRGLGNQVQEENYITKEKLPSNKC